MTPTEKDAMALAVLVRAENVAWAHAAGDEEAAPDSWANHGHELREARAHLASRIADQAEEIRALKAEVKGLAQSLTDAIDQHEDAKVDAKFIREAYFKAEAELAAVRANAITPQHGELGAAIDRAAGELPEGWEIRVCIERGAGWAELYSPGYEQVELPDRDGTLADRITAAIDAARGGE